MHYVCVVGCTGDGDGDKIAVCAVALALVKKRAVILVGALFIAEVAPAGPGEPTLLLLSSHYRPSRSLFPVPLSVSTSPH